jgi:TRAP-type C4-dicarboxylate transport system permease large subunit
MSNDTLLAVPLFVFMGVMLERSQIAERLLDRDGGAVRRLRGGLAISVMLVGACSRRTGIVGATVVTMGLICAADDAARRLRPEAGLRHDLRLGHARPDHSALGDPGAARRRAWQCLPAGTVVKQGNYAPKTVSVGDLFAGAILPGLGWCCSTWST